MCSCCPADAEPLREMKDYKPKHEMTKIQSLNCYVAMPSAAATQGVIMFTDMFGVNTGRHKQFCDMLAGNGYLAVCPDFIGERPYMSSLSTPSFGMNYCCAVEFLFKFFSGNFGRKTKSFAWETYMKQKVMGELVPWMKMKGVSSFAAVGFCWGTYGAMKCAAYPEFKCCAGFHPSTEGFCKNTGEDDLEVCRSIKCPQLMIATKSESEKWRPNGEAHKACEMALPGKVTWHLQDNAMHGYMTRGDTLKPETMEAVKYGFESMMTLFKQNL